MSVVLNLDLDKFFSGIFGIDVFDVSMASLTTESQAEQCAIAGDASSYITGQLYSSEPYSKLSYGDIRLTLLNDEDPNKLLYKFEVLWDAVKMGRVFLVMIGLSQETPSEEEEPSRRVTQQIRTTVLSPMTVSSIQSAPLLTQVCFFKVIHLTHIQLIANNFFLLYR